MQGRKTRTWAVGRLIDNVTDIIRYNEGSLYTSTLKMEEAYFSVQNNGHDHQTTGHHISEDSNILSSFQGFSNQIVYVFLVSPK
jgi:hypothetical protein